MLKHTALHDLHQEREAKLAPSLGLTCPYIIVQVRCRNICFAVNGRLCSMSAIWVR